MSDLDAAVTQYKTVLDSLVTTFMLFEKERIADGDVLTVVADEGGIGRMIMIRNGSKLISLHNGPTSGASPWNEDLMLDNAYSIFERVSST